MLVEWVDHEVGLAALAAVGHRVVHGGGRYSQPEPVTDDLLAELRRISPYDPEHLPGEIDLIEAFRRLDPALPQVACFDTAFHHDLPRVAQIVPIPRRFEAAGVRRYGFHGLSYAFLMGELERVAGAAAARGRVVLAHLGAGSSLAAVHGGRPVDTTMGFTPASGLVMGTRTGDIDPGLVRFLVEAGGLTVESFHAMVNHESGLLGVSETSPDLRDLLARQGEDVRAAEAVELYCYRVKAGIGALAAALGGLETLVFAGGIGENSPEVRRRVCDGLGFLGVALDNLRNEAGAAVISADGGPVTVRVIRTDEEVMIARAAAGVFARAAGDPPRARGRGVVWGRPVSTLRNTSEDEDARRLRRGDEAGEKHRRGRRRARTRPPERGNIVMENTLHDHSETANGARPTPPGAVSAEGRDDSRPPPAADATAPPDPRAAGPATDPSPAAPPPASGAPSHPWRRGLLWAGAVAGLAFGGYALTPTVKTMMETVSTDDAYVNGHVTYVAPRVAGQVSRVLVDDNDRVSKGDLLVQLDREPYQVQVDLKKAAVVNAEVDVEAARAEVRGILAQARSQRWKLQRAIEDVDDKVAQLKARVAALRSKEASLDRAKADFARASSSSTGARCPARSSTSAVRPCGRPRPRPSRRSKRSMRRGSPSASTRTPRGRT